MAQDKKENKSNDNNDKGGGIPRYLQRLNEQQRAAVQYCDGPQLVIAGAGSGKTRVLTYKIVHLLHQGYEPWRIMALTFTNKAAREMRERIEALTGPDVAARLWMGTFHSIFSRLLRHNAERIGFKHDFTIYDTSDSRSLIKLIVRDMGLDDKLYKPAALQARISQVKNALIAPDDYVRNPDLMQADVEAGMQRTADIYRAYWQRCRVAGAMDFDDLLFYMNILLRDNPDVLARYQEMFAYILVDEYQDTNFAQHLIVHQLSRLHNHLCVVGDDAQSIYSFRGANINNILNLHKVYKELKIFKLEQNYRSTQAIIGAANSLIAKNSGQIPKELFSANEFGSVIPVTRCFSDYEEAYVVANQIAATKARQGDSYEDFAVLYRTNAQSRVLEEAFSSGGRRDKHGHTRDAIPYRIFGGLSFYQRKEVKDAVCYFRLIINPDDDEALRRVINYPARGIGDVTVGKINHCAVQHGVSLWTVINNPEANELNVNRGTLAKLNSFVDLIKGLIELNSGGADAHEVAEQTYRRTRILSVLMADRTPENISRQENLTELLNAVAEFADTKQEMDDAHNTIGDFLAETALLTDQDKEDPDGEKVTLMTIHSAKGLEFKNVFIVGVEEDLLPSAMSIDTLQGLEEERRLMYVAITRAKRYCAISYATSRYHNGQTKTCVMSRFLKDIDPKFLHIDMGEETSSRDRWQDDADELARLSGFGGMRAGGRSWMQRDEQATTPSPSSARRTSLQPPARRSLSPSVTPPSSRQRGSSAPTSTSSAQFTLHAASELSAGMHIVHSRFGNGEIQEVDAATSKIVATFNDGVTRTLMLKFAKFEIK